MVVMLSVDWIVVASAVVAVVAAAVDAGLKVMVVVASVDWIVVSSAVDASSEGIIVVAETVAMEIPKLYYIRS